MLASRSLYEILPMRQKQERTKEIEAADPCWLVQLRYENGRAIQRIDKKPSIGLLDAEGINTLSDARLTGF
jgi:hypothetical protein